MELRQAVFAVCLLLFPFLIIAQSNASTDAIAFTDSATTPCGTNYIAGCLSTAIIAACGDVSQTACICGISGQGAIGSLVGPCLLAQCPVTEILAIGNFATSVCDEWLKTHLMTTTTGGYGNTTSTAFIPTSTTFSSVTMSGLAYMSITSSPTTPTSFPTSTSTSTASSHHLSVGADVGIGVGALAIVSVLAVVTFFYLRHRRPRKQHSLEAHELQTVDNIPELPDRTDRPDDVQVVTVSSEDVGRFDFSFPKPEVAPVEIDSQSVRAQSRGRVAGTETTAFDFESQKVLLTPELRDKSRASSRAPESSPTSLRRHNTDT